MKRRRKNISRVIEFLWPTPESMEAEYDIDVDNIIFTNKKTGKSVTPFITGSRKKDNTYYSIRVYRNGESYNVKIHLMLFYKKYRFIPEQIDHIDRNKHNNNINNLRALSRGLNGYNRVKFKFRNNKPLSSKYKGVSFAKDQKNKWVAYSSLNRKFIRLGSFLTEDEAGEAVNQFYIQNNLENFAVFNDTPEEKIRKANRFDALPKELNNIKSLFI